MATGLIETKEKTRLALKSNIQSKHAGKPANMTLPFGGFLHHVKNLTRLKNDFDDYTFIQEKETTNERNRN